MPSVLISDANILIDMEEAGIVNEMFALDAEFLVPNVLFAEELEASHAHLVALGLKVQEVSEQGVGAALELLSGNNAMSANDLLAYMLAVEADGILLTGDANLRRLAEVRGDVEVHGTLWLMARMVREAGFSVQRARVAFEMMRECGRRLPWKDVNALLHRLEGEL